MSGGCTVPEIGWMYPAALSVGGAWLLSGRDRERRRARLLFAGSDPACIGTLAPRGADMWRRTPWRLLGRRLGRFRRRCGPEALCLPAGGALAALSASVVPLLAALVALPVLGRWLRARQRQHQREQRADRVIEWCASVVGELRAGRQPIEALLGVPARGLGDQWPLVPAAARFGGDVPGALRRAAEAPGAEGLTGVAACWQVAADGGAGLVAGLDRVGAALRAERAQRQRLRAQLASQRATCVVLAVLPVVVLLIGSVMGADPLRVVLHTPAGLACLLAGGLLEWAGLAWTARVLRAATTFEGGRAKDG